MKFRKKVILAKIETVYGTDAVPTGAANAILASNVNISPFEGETISRDNVQPYLGSRQMLHVGINVMLEFDVEAAGAGAAGDVPGYGALLRGCGWAETITAATDVQYDPVSLNEEALTMHFHIDGHKHALLGARGTCSIRMNAKQIPVMHFRFLGLFVAVAAAADPTPTLTNFKLPKSVSNANTPTFTLHGYAGKMDEFTFDQNNSVVHRDLVGEESVQISDRQSAGSIKIESPALGTKDYFAIATLETLAALQMIHGSGAGGIYQIDAPQVQLLQPNYSEKDGIVMLDMGLNFVPSSTGDDEFKITVK